MKSGPVEANKTKVMNIVVLGPKKVGKSNSLKILKGKKYDKYDEDDEYKATVGVDPYTHTFEDGAKARIFDCSGDDSNYEYTLKFILSADAVIFAMDASSPETEKEAIAYLKTMLNEIRLQYKFNKTLQLRLALTKADKYNFTLDDTNLSEKTHEFSSALTAEDGVTLLPLTSYFTSAKHPEKADPTKPYKDMQAKFKELYPDGKEIKRRSPKKVSEVRNDSQSEKIVTSRNCGDCLIGVAKLLVCLGTCGLFCNPCCDPLWRKIYRILTRGQ